MARTSWRISVGRLINGKGVADAGIKAGRLGLDLGATLLLATFLLCGAATGSLIAGLSTLDDFFERL